MSEIYVVTGGAGQVIAYNDDFFPVATLGKGRAVDTPKGLHVDGEGRVYICQGDMVSSPPRLTILNGAFFKQQEILMSDIPGAENFLPHRITKRRNGFLYLAGLNFRGVLVLKKDGTFFHWLKPEDTILEVPTAEDTEFTMETMKKNLEGAPDTESGSSTTATKDPLEVDTTSLPPELTPEVGRSIGGGDEQAHIGPIQITDLTTDNDGHLYLLSEETGKIYVYGADDELLFSFGKKGGSSGKLSRPRGLAVDTKKRCIYVVDYMRHTIVVFDLSGRFLFEFGGLGTAPRWFNFPTDIAVDALGRVIVADLFNQRVQVLELDFPPIYPLFAPASRRIEGKTKE
jgi:DNA-binding beta-propeller fold protein YncE